jgi:hypothetical protein
MRSVVQLNRLHSPSHDTSSRQHSNQSPVLLPDKTGNIRHTASDTSTDPIFPTAPPTDPPFQTFSNESSVRSPDKTGNIRKIELKKTNFRDPTMPIHEKALG